MSFSNDADKFITSIFTNRFDKGSSREFGVVDTAIVTLLSAMVDKVDTMQFLNNNKHPSEINTIFRTLIEQHFYIAYVFQKYTDQRARAYFIHERYEELDKVKILILKISDRKLSESIEKSVNKMISKSTSKDRSLDEALQRYKSEYNSLFDSARKRNGGRRIPGTKTKNQFKWFNTNFDGINSIFDLAQSIGEEDLYHTMYRLLSMDVHGVDLPANVHVENIIDPHRNIAMIALNVGSDSTSSVDYAIALTMQSIQKVAKYYNMGATKAYRDLGAKYKIGIELRRSL